MSTNLKELKESVKNFWDGNDDFYGIVYVNNSKDVERGIMNGILAAHGSEAEILGSIMIIAKQCGISLSQLAYMCVAIDSDEKANDALESIIANINGKGEKKESDESQESGKCDSCGKDDPCGKCCKDEAEKRRGMSKKDAIEALLKEIFDED